jgi:AraC-like DNA-binding protein
LSLAEIAEHVGYASEAAFSRAFKKIVGDPPAAWRRQRSAAAASDLSRGG